MWGECRQGLRVPRESDSGVDMIRWPPDIEVAAVTYADDDHCYLLELSGGGNVLPWGYTSSGAISLGRESP